MDYTTAGGESETTMDSRKTVGEGITDGGLKESNYVSPSDAILSPTSKKLREIKGRRLEKMGGGGLLKKMVQQSRGSKEEGEKS